MAPVALVASQMLLLLLLASTSEAQIRVVAPHDLSQKYVRGRIEGSTSMFGAPFYGDKVLGRLVYAESTRGFQYCTPDDYSIEQERHSEDEESEKSERGKLIDIVMVRRGNCSFVKKVQIAADKGAHAVIIVDKESSTLTSQDLQRIIVADDGYGSQIKIPSVLISSMDGAHLFEASQKRAAPVIVELSWEVPMGHVVQVDLWMSSASKQSGIFLKEFWHNRKELNGVIRFQPHYDVFQISPSNSQIFNELCTDSTGSFCAEDPDGAGQITGKQVLEEDVRQLCIHDLTKVARESEQSKRANEVVFYAEKYWKYVSEFVDTCPLDAKNPQDRFGEECSEAVQRNVGIDVDLVRECVRRTKDQKLQNERENPAWSMNALRINGWRYSGILDAELVTRAICAGFISAPDQCQTLFKPRDPTTPYVPQPVTQGVTMGTFFLWLSIAACVFTVAALLYKRHLKQNVHTVLREEVMLEVQAQMGQYAKLGS